LKYKDQNQEIFYDKILEEEMIMLKGRGDAVRRK
jgi:hypothetical protein